MARYETLHTYTGESEGIAKLVDGMYEYGEEINLRRSLPDIRDGFKYVQRRVLYSVLSNSQFWKGELHKSALLIGEAIKRHPHGDASIYDVIARLTTNTEYLALAPLRGGGSWGSKVSGEKAAAFRYTDFGISDYFRQYRNEFLDGVTYMEGELKDGSMEPEYLSIPFPNILANESAGIGFGLAANIPSYNVGELADLTIKLVKNGSLQPTDIIHPDFTTGGFVVADASVASKIMLKGIATYRTRAKVGIEGSEIKVFEVPAGTNLTSMKKSLATIIKEDKLPDIKSFQDAQGYVATKGDTSKSILNIYCKRGTAEKVLHELYARNILENHYTVNMMATHGDTIVMGGVHRFLADWVEFRKTHLKNKYLVQIDSFQDELAILNIFLKLVNDVPNKKEYLRLLTEVSRKEADDFLRELFPGVSDETVTWVRGRTAESFRDGASYKNRFDSIQATINEFNNNLNDLNSVIVRELEDFKKKFGRPRRTQLTTNAYSFKKLKAQGGTAARPKLVDDSKAYFAFSTDGFIFKSRKPINTEGTAVAGTFEARANTNFLAFDSTGRLFRVFGEELPYTDNTTGTYIYRYAGVEPSEGTELLYACPNDGEARHILLHSGNFMVFDPKHHETVQKIRYKNRAVNTAITTEGIAHIFEPGTLPKNLLIIDEHVSRAGSDPINRVGILQPETLREAKSSNTKIKAFGQSSKKIVGYVDVPDEWFNGNLWLTDEFLRTQFTNGTLRKLPGYREVTDAFDEDFNLVDRLIWVD